MTERILIMHKDGILTGSIPSGRTIEIHDQGAMGNSVAYASANAAALMYALGQLGPFGPPTEPPKAKTPKPIVAPASTPLRDRKAELRRLKASKARAARLVKRLKSRKPSTPLIVIVPGDENTNS